jgi:hypothetical protein
MKFPIVLLFCIINTTVAPRPSSVIMSLVLSSNSQYVSFPVCEIHESWLQHVWIDCRKSHVLCESCVKVRRVFEPKVRSQATFAIIQSESFKYTAFHNLKTAYGFLRSIPRHGLNRKLQQTSDSSWRLTRSSSAVVSITSRVFLGCQTSSCGLTWPSHFLCMSVPIEE